MYDHTGTSVHSAKALSELYDKKAKEAERQKAASSLATKLATDQVTLLEEANNLTKRAQIDAQESKEDSERASRMAFWANAIATASLLVAIASFLFAYISSST